MKKTIIRLIILLLLLPTLAIADTLRVTYIDVGQGDAALVQCGGQSMLIDTGSVESREALLSFLDQTGIIAIDYVVGTHPKDDHIGGIADVLSMYDVQSIWMPRVRNETKAFDQTLLAIKQTNHLIDPPVVGNEVMLGDAIVTVLAPNSEVYENLEDYSIVIRIDHGRNSFLFLGDVGQVSINEMLASQLNLSANVVKVNKHGASVSNESTLLSAISPSIAVISCDHDNEPSNATLEALGHVGAMVLRTDELGNIQIESDRTTLFYDKEIALGEEEWYGRINTKNVNVRKGASRGDDRVAYLDEGTSVRVLLTIENDAGETWYLVDINGLQGYIRSDFIDPVNPLALDTTDGEEGEEVEESGDGLDEYFSLTASPSPAPTARATIGPIAATISPAATASPTATAPSQSALPTIPLTITTATSSPTAAQSTPQPTKQVVEAPYIGNAISMIFHKSTCDSLPSTKNRVPFEVRNAAIQAGFIPCSVCTP